MRTSAWVSSRAENQEAPRDGLPGSTNRVQASRFRSWRSTPATLQLAAGKRVPGWGELLGKAEIGTVDTVIERRSVLARSHLTQENHQRGDRVEPGIHRVRAVQVRDVEVLRTVKQDDSLEVAGVEQLERPLAEIVIPTERRVGDQESATRRRRRSPAMLPWSMPSR